MAAQPSVPDKPGPPNAEAGQTGAGKLASTRLEDAFGGHEQVTDAKRLAGLLEGLRASRALLSVRIDDRSVSFNTALLKIDADEGVIYLDELVPAYGHRRVQPGSTLRVSGMLNRMPAHFSTLVLETGRQKGVAYYRATLPTRLDYRQRRASFRVHVPRSYQVEVEFTTREGEAFQARMLDISQGGFAVTALRNAPVKVLDALEVDDLELPGMKSFACKVQVRYLLAGRDDPTMRVGLRFTRIDVPAQRALARVIMDLEREAIRTRSK